MNLNPWGMDPDLWKMDPDPQFQNKNAYRISKVGYTESFIFIVVISGSCVVFVAVLIGSSLYSLWTNHRSNLQLVS